MYPFLVGLLVVLLPISAWAQEVSETAAPAEETAAPEELEVITVNANKRTERLEDVPQSITPISGEDFQFMRASGADIRILSARVPSLTIESSFGRVFPRAYIRGLGNTDFDLNASQPVSIIQDDVVLENPITKAFPLFDIERVEVQRGPQGTLFGRNTTAGVIRFNSRNPSHDERRSFRLAYGSFNYVGVEAATDVSVVDQVFAIRAAINYERRSGWVDNTFEDDNESNDSLGGFGQLAGRIKALWTPSDNFEALLTLKGHTFSSNTGRIFRANVIEPGTEDFVDGFERDQVALDGEGDQELDQFGASLKLTYDFGEVSLVSVTALERITEFTSRGDIDGGFGAAFLPDGGGPGVIPFPAETADAIPGLTQITQELRILSNDWEGFNFQAGLFLFSEDLEIETINFDTLSGRAAVNGFASQEQQNTAFGIFGNVNYDLTPELQVSGGLRYSNDSKDYTASRSQSPIGAGELEPESVDPSADFVSWDASIRYQPTRSFTAFVRAATAYRAPSIQGRLLFGDVITIGDEEDILSFEAGIKAGLADNRIRLGLTGYLYTLNNQQLTAVGGGANFNQLINVDQTQGSGAEFELDVLPIANLFIRVGVGLNVTEIQDPEAQVAVCGAPCTVFYDVGDGDDGLASLDGNPLPNAPEWTASLIARYDIPVDEVSNVFLNTDWAYRSAVEFFLYRSAEFRDSSLVQGGARVGYSYNGGEIEAALFSRNITGNLSKTGAIDFNNLTAFVNEPRTFGVEVRANY